MQYRINYWLWAMAVILGLRLTTMVWFPLADTSEPRYAEIARLMAATGDWVTPWFSEGIPFWGKPPLAFWSEALSFKLLGVNEFAARLPSWLATLGSLALIFTLAKAYFGIRIAKGSALVYSTCALVYVVSGAVLTDPFLALATTGSMVAFALSSQQASWYWKYAFFIFIAIGLLAKGPLTLVLVGGPLILAMLCHRSARDTFMQLPWWRGLVLMMTLSMPWYILAELKTPGFLNYFLVGEHFLRFIDSGWSGDLYGTAHKESKGTIWIHVLIASFPWGIAGLYILIGKFTDPNRRHFFRQAYQDPKRIYLFVWTIFTPVFFSFSGNILWTYVLPSLASFSILIGLAVDRWIEKSQTRWIFLGLVGVTPLVLTGYLTLGILEPQGLKTEKELVAYAMLYRQPGDELVFLDSAPFSANFYSRGQAQVVTLDDLRAAIASASPVTLYLAISKNDYEMVSQTLTVPLVKEFESLRYVLTTIRGQP